MLGIRQEVLEINKQLDQLKEYSKIEPKYVKDYYYYISKFGKMLPELMVYVKNNPLKYMNFRAILRGQFEHISTATTKMVKDNNGIYYPLTGTTSKKHACHVRIDSEYEKEFEKLASTILNSDFATKPSILVSTYSEDGISYFTKEPHNFKFKTPRSELYYFDREDTLTFAGYMQKNKIDNQLTKEHLNAILEIEIPKSSFSTYYQNIIEKGLEPKHEIILDENFEPTIYTKLKINEDGKRLVLSKIKE